MVKNEIREKLNKFLETNENVLTTIQNIWDTAKAVLRGKFIHNRNISNEQPRPMPTRIPGIATKITQNKYKEGNNQDQSRVK